eukprot:2436104-Prorocentrum_lima.AAC.1
MLVGPPNNPQAQQSNAHDVQGVEPGETVKGVQEEANTQTTKKTKATARNPMFTWMHLPLKGNVDA